VQDRALLIRTENEEVRADARQFLDAVGHDRVEGLIEVV